METLDLSGLELARRYHDEVVGPLLWKRWPRLSYAGARLGSGSDVLGVDDVMSRDHDWGLRLTCLVEEGMVSEVDEYLERSLPEHFLGLPTRFAVTWDQRVHQRVRVDTPGAFVASRLGVDARRGLSVGEWLSLPGQSLLEVTAGAVFWDGSGEITRLREYLTWYPHDLWLYTLAADWQRLSEELPFVGRTGVRGDDLGSRVVTARLVEILMHLGFLLERQWVPYPKWRGTMFSRLPCASKAHPHLQGALQASTWEERQESLARAIGVLAVLQDSLGLPLAGEAVEAFWERPFHALRAGVVESLTGAIQDPSVRALPGGVGSLEQWTGSVAVLAQPERRGVLARQWEEVLG